MFRVTTGKLSCDLLLASCLAALSLAACTSDPPPPPPRPPVTAAPAAPAPDRVDPGEVPEGAEQAFGLPIPRAMRVDARFPDAVRAEGPVPLDATANYVRARVVAERVETGPAKTVFSRATLKSAPDRLLRVEVIAHGDRTEMIVRDETRPPSSDAVKPTDPWNKPGFDPRDRQADPKRFE
jgi:hypothetical protein